MEPTGVNKILVEKYGYEWGDGFHKISPIEYLIEL